VTALREMGPALLPAAQLAVDHINQDPYTLPGFRVELINAESGCSTTTKALVTLVKHVVHSERNGRSITGIIGPSCSESAIVVSSVIARGGPLALPNVHITTSAELEDRERYPYTFGIIGSRSQIVDALVSLIGYNGWNKVAILYDESRASDALYANQRLREEVWDENFGKGDVSTIHTPVSNNFFPLETLIKNKVQIGIVMTTLTLAQKLMCIAYHEGLTFPGYQWIITEYSFNEFTEQNTTFYYEGRLYECFWGIVLDHVIFIHFQMAEVDTTLQLVSGYTYTDITKQYETKMDFYKYSNVCFFPAIPNFNRAATTYDAVWALVFTMNMSISSDSKINILDKFPSVNFRGASGHITFDKSTGFVKRVVDIVQIENGITISAGSVFQGNGSFNIDPRIRYITSSQQPQYATVNPILSAIFILAGVILLLSTAVVHVVTLLNRKHPSVKASSYGLNQFVFLACYIWGVVAIIYTLVLKALGLSDFVVIGNACNALLVWLIPIALTLSFGTLIAKTWRIYRIFIHFRQPGPLLTNKALTMMVLVQLGIDIVIATTWTIVSPIMLIAVEELYTNENGENVIPRMCVYTNTAIWVTMTVGYKFLQLTALFILCIMTRAIKNRKFSTTSLKVASYLCLLTIAITGPIYAILWYTNAEIHADFVVFCVFFGAIGFTLLILVLLPPVLPMLMGYLCHRHRRK
jgi:ABC-type branched-subunit amino acid transport system substrate-binding protein